MKKPLYVLALVFALLLSAAPAFAAPPGKGEITVNPGGAVTSLTVRYDLDSFMGEPLVKAAYKWESPTLDTIDGNTGIWLLIQDNVLATNQAYIWAGDGVPGTRGEWSDDVASSPGWNKVLVQTWEGNNVVQYISAEIAKQYWKNGFRVIGARFSRKPGASAQQTPSYKPPGKGEITAKPGGAITSLTVRYNLGSLMGEPLVAAAFKWESPTRAEIDPDTVVWLKIQDNANPGRTAFIRIGDGVPGKRGQWSQDFTGSPGWGTVLVESYSGNFALDYLDIAAAKQFWQNGFKVIGAELSKSYESTLHQSPKNKYGQWSHWMSYKDQPNVYYRFMCDSYDAAKQKYVWRLQVQNRDPNRRLTVTTRINDAFNKQNGPENKLSNLNPGTLAQFYPYTYLDVGWVHPNGSDDYPISLTYIVEWTDLPKPAQPQQQAKTSGSITIRPQDFAKGESSWSQSGPSYEGNENIRNYGATHTHVYGKTAGKFTYYFSLPSGKYSEGKLSARLSSEFPYFGDQTPKDGYSEVALYINNSFIGTKTVIPDNGSGAWYSWAVPAAILREGSNRIEFVVQPNGRYCNGLAIYEKSLTGNEQNAQIIVEFSRTY